MKNKFLYGATLLSVSGIIVKILGAFFKIPIGGLLQPEGMADFSVAYNIYALLFVLATAGVPVALSKTVAEAEAVNSTGEKSRIFKTGLVLFTAIGTLGSALMYLLSDEIAQLVSSKSSADAIRAVAPAVFFVSVSAVFRGYYQGLDDMRPTAISQVIEAAVKLTVGFGAAYILASKGYATNIAAAGAVSGVSAGALLSCVYLVLFGRKKLFIKSRNEELSLTPHMRIARELIKLSVPVMLGSAVINLTNVIDSALIMRILNSIGYSQERSMWLYGSYNYACNLFNLPSTVVTTLAISLVPTVSSAYAKGDIRNLQKTSTCALEIAMLFAFPAAAGMLALAEPIIFLLYGKTLEQSAVSVAGSILFCLAFAVPALSTVSITNAIHQACGRANLPVMSMLAGAIVKLLSNSFIIRIEGLNIKGAALSTILCYTVIAFINLIALKKHKIKIDIPRVYLLPLVLSVATGISARSTYALFEKAQTPRLGTAFAIISGVCVCGLCMSVLVIKGKKREKIKVSSK